jgi:hypothetical protein
MPKAGFNPNVGLALCVLVLSASGLVASAPQPASMDWIHVVRIGAYGLQRNNAQTIVRQATESHVFGIEVDNDITGRYQSFLDPLRNSKRFVPSRRRRTVPAIARSYTSPVPNALPQTLIRPRTH